MVDHHEALAPVGAPEGNTAEVSQDQIDRMQALNGLVSGERLVPEMVSAERRAQSMVLQPS